MGPKRGGGGKPRRRRRKRRRGRGRRKRKRRRKFPKSHQVQFLPVEKKKVTKLFR